MNLIINMNHYSKHNLEYSEFRDSDARIAFFVLKFRAVVKFSIETWWRKFNHYLRRKTNSIMEMFQTYYHFFEFLDGQDF